MVDVSLRSRRPWQPWLVAIVAGAVVCLLWAVPAAIAGGGWSAWIRTTQGQSRYLVFADTVVNHGGRAVSAHLHVFLPFVHAELPLVLAAAALGAAAAVLGRLSPEMPRRGRIRPWTFFSVWALPSIGFYILIFVNGPPGYTLVFLPAVYVALAVATERFATRVRAVWKGGGQASMPWIPSLAAAILLLTALPQVAADTRDTYHHDVTQREAQWQAWLDLLDPSTAMDTAVLTDERYEHAKWYRPDHAVFTVGTRLDANGHVTWHWVFEARHHQDDVEIWNIDLWRSSPPHPLDPGIRRIVIIEPFLVEGPRALVRPDAPLRSGTLDDGTSYSYIEVGPGSHTLEEYLHLEPAS